MRLHIIGICGTFMGSLALLARELGHEVSGSDANVYPPMSTQLAEAGITLMEGYQAANLSGSIDLVVVGNALSRGNPEVEALLNSGMRYTSGAQWLADYVLPGRKVIAVAGTHGKTTTASLLAWLLESAGLKPGFLIGGVPRNFGVSARLGDENAPFVVEADEYDTAFFDKRSKFVHYRPTIAVLNNLEFDHADIFEDLNAIKKQFHHLMRTLPCSGKVIWPSQDEALQDVIDRGLWSESETLSGDWDYRLLKADGSEFEVLLNSQVQGVVSWQAMGEHNVKNAIMAIAAARHVGIAVSVSIAGLAEFISPKRRMELKADINSIKVYDDFAHHPTAIKTTLAGLRAKVGTDKIIAILEPRSNTMKMGVHQQTLIDSLDAADDVYLFEPENLSWSLKEFADKAGMHCMKSTEEIITQVVGNSAPSQHILIMSNGGFEGIHQRLISALEQN